MKKKLFNHGLWLKIMKVSIIQMVFVVCFVGLCYASDANGQEMLETRISIHLEDKSLKTILSKLEKEAKVKFMYSAEVIQAERISSLNAKNQSLGEVLDAFLSPLNISYRSTNNGIVLTPKAFKLGQIQGVQPTKIELTIPADITIKGTVTDESGEKLPGVSITVKGTSRGVISNTNGEFAITIPDEKTLLVFSFVGYLTQEIAVENRTQLNITLKQDSKALDEVVVVGYGTQIKKDISGSVSRISSEEIKAYPVMSADQALQGRAAGVQVFQSSGAPGGAVQVRIRGVNSTAGEGANQPLYVIDGIPLSTYNEGLFAIGSTGDNTGASASNAQSPLSTINPNDIESIEVLKDASATAIYGARAANGVVMITTKSGKNGTSKIEFNSYYGIQSLRREVPMINARERMIIVGEQRRNSGTFGTDEIDVFAVNPYFHSEGTNWQREVFRQAAMSNYNLAISGGTDKINYLISGDYQQQDGIVINTYSNRLSFRTNIDVKVSNKLKIGTRTALSNQWDNSALADNNTTGLSYIFQLPPSMKVKDEDGNYSGRVNSLVRGEIFGAAGNANLPTFNIVADLMENERNANRSRIVSNLYAEYKILPYMTFKSTFGIDYLFGELRQFLPLWQRGLDRNNAMTLNESRPKNQNWVADQFLTIDKNFAKHKVNAVAGLSAQSNTSYSFSVSTTGSTSNILNTLSNQTIFNGTPNGGQITSSIVSQFLRTNYSYDGKYLFTGTIRRDGSSRFGSNNKFGYFPSFSVGWRLIEEPFMKNIKAISDLKLRASYGITGNQNIGNFLYQGLATGTSAVFGNVITAGVAPTRFDNPDIRWEQNKQIDIGAEIGIFDNRLNLVVDYYRKTTDGLLASYPISLISGVGNSVIRNIGTIENRGFEFALNSILVDKKDFKWTANFNISTNQNEVKSLGLLPFINGATINRVGTFMNRTQVGQPIGAFYVLETNGMYTTAEQLNPLPVYRASATQFGFRKGDFRLADQNNDGIIDDNDRVFYGSPFPDFFGGLSTNLSYKGITLNAVSSFQVGNLIYNYPHMTATLGEANMWRTDFENRYRPDEPLVETTTQLPRVGTPIAPSTTFLEDGSFFRIRSLGLSYTFPSALIKKYAKNIKVYAQANNFFVLTKYKGWDPEVNSFGSNVLSNGFDFGAYPQAKSMIFGVNLGF